MMLGPLDTGCRAERRGWAGREANLVGDLLSLRAADHPDPTAALRKGVVRGLGSLDRRGLRSERWPRKPRRGHDYPGGSREQGAGPGRWAGPAAMFPWGEGFRKRWGWSRPPNPEPRAAPRPGSSR